MKYFKKIRSLLTVQEYRQVIFILVLTFIMSLIDMIGVASILPFIAILTNPQLLNTNAFLKSFYETSNLFGVDSQQDFLFLLGIIVFFLLIAFFMMNNGLRYKKKEKTIFISEL